VLSSLIFVGFVPAFACACLCVHACLALPSMMGDVNFFSVTPNGQYVFSSVSRPAYVLSAMERLVAVCDKLRDDPNNVFLKSWSFPCASSPVRWRHGRVWLHCYCCIA